MKQKIANFLQPVADAIVEMVKTIPDDDMALQVAMFGLSINDWLTDRGIYLK